MDLAKPEWKGRWAASPSGADFQAIVSAMLALKGEQATLEWLKAMKTNATAYKGNSTVMKAVNAGQIDGGVIYHYYPLLIKLKPVRTAAILNCITSKIRIPALRQYLWRGSIGFQQTSAASPEIRAMGHRQSGAGFLAREQ